MTLAVIDRLVHHATILEMNVDSYRETASKKPHNRTTANARDDQGVVMIVAPRQRQQNTACVPVAPRQS